MPSRVRVWPAAGRRAVQAARDRVAGGEAPVAGGACGAGPGCGRCRVGVLATLALQQVGRAVPADHATD
ncbi:MAG: hypothetical protein K6T81_07800 [Alicyclobacillus macrosporangiidus]|uniref:hypothetical protein n=1 Tax=Alicyclobacillus macrosporangiidus TaxID=392015 RepID=UPI0026EE06DE|nr:hypothetical protein [Alicyclobacillus macrosporangiidus]MCL6598628.1 hypothetical protein [Alicyclobacillus macrosporangiidus]